MISILSAAADADVNGTWLPLLGGQVPANSPTLAPPAPGDYGLKAQFMGNDAAFAAAPAGWSSTLLAARRQSVVAGCLTPAKR